MTDTLSAHISTPRTNTHTTLHPTTNPVSTNTTLTSSTSTSTSAASRPVDPLAEYATYEDYLDSQLTADDHKYIESEDIMRALVELGYRGTQDTLKRDEFTQRKANAAALLTLSATTATAATTTASPSAITGGSLPPKLLTHTLSTRPLSTLPPFLRALADREESIRTGRLSCIAYLRHHNTKGQEVSGYIDVNDRMRADDWTDVWDGRRKVAVKPTDLSYFNWDSGTAVNTHSPNWQVKVDDDEDMEAKTTNTTATATTGTTTTTAGVSDGKVRGGGGLVCPASAVRGGGLLFKNKRDRKCMSVDPDPSVDCGDNSRRVVIDTSEYIQCVIYDHMTRRKM